MTSRQENTLERHYILGWRRNVSFAFCAMAAGTLIYGVAVYWAYQNLVSAYEQADAMAVVLQRDATTGGAPEGFRPTPGAASQPNFQDTYLRWLALYLIGAGIAPEDEARATAPSSQANPHSAWQQRVASMFPGGDKCDAPMARVRPDCDGAVQTCADVFTKGGTPRLDARGLAFLGAQNCGANATGKCASACRPMGKGDQPGVAQDNLQLHARRMAELLAGGFDYPIRLWGSTNPDPKIPSEFPLDWVPFRFVVLPSSPPAPLDIVRNLFRIEPADEPLPQNQKYLVDAGLKSIAALQSDAGVKSARLWLVVILGLEQWLLIIIGCYAATLLYARRARLRRQSEDLRWFSTEAKKTIETANSDTGRDWLYKNEAETLIQNFQQNKEGRWKDWSAATYNSGPAFLAYQALMLVVRSAQPKDNKGTAAVIRPEPSDFRDLCDREASAVANSRAVLTWCGRALVGIGFFGTIRGIMSALSQADSIVAATNKLEQIAAISNVAGALGLAFATTIIALGINIILGLLLARQFSQELQLILRAESQIIPIVRPSLLEGYTASVAPAVSTQSPKAQEI